MPRQQLLARKTRRPVNGVHAATVDRVVTDQSKVIGQSGRNAPYRTVKAHRMTWQANHPAGLISQRVQKPLQRLLRRPACRSKCNRHRPRQLPLLKPSHPSLHPNLFQHLWQLRLLRLLRR